jgi:hypothetical protein
VKGDELALAVHGGVERGDVRVPYDRFRRSRKRLVIDPRKNAHHSVPAAQTPDRIDFGITKRAIHVVQSIAIVSGEISDAFCRVRSDDRLPAERARVLLRARQLIRLL